MVNIFNHIMGVLAVTGGLPTNDKDEVVLTQEQTKQIDDKLGDLNKQVTDLTTAKDADKLTIQSLQDELKQVKDQLAASEEKVKNLEGAPGASTSQAGLETKDDSPEAVMNRAQELFNSVM